MFLLQLSGVMRREKMARHAGKSFPLATTWRGMWNSSTGTKDPWCVALRAANKNVTANRPWRFIRKNSMLRTRTTVSFSLTIVQFRWQSCIQSCRTVNLFLDFLGRQNPLWHGGPRLHPEIQEQEEHEGTSAGVSAQSWQNQDLLWGGWLWLLHLSDQEHQEVH